MLNSIFVITYRDGNGNTYSDLSRNVERDLEVLTREQPRATVICIDRQGGN